MTDPERLRLIAMAIDDEQKSGRWGGDKSHTPACRGPHVQDTLRRIADELEKSSGIKTTVEFGFGPLEEEMPVIINPTPEEMEAGIVRIDGYLTLDGHHRRESTP